MGIFEVKNELTVTPARFNLFMFLNFFCLGEELYADMKIGDNSPLFDILLGTIKYSRTSHASYITLTLYIYIYIYIYIYTEH